MQRAGRQKEEGLELVKQYDFVTIREHIKGIKNDDYEFYDQYPNCKEVLILGAANAGKSTLINALNGAYDGAGGEKIAYAAKQKGKTYQLNFYLARHRHDRKKRYGMIVDSPGYGRTAAPVKLKEKWVKMLHKYLCYGVRINLILLCIQAHRGVTGQDLKVINDLKYFGKAVHIVVTKVDQCRNNEQLADALTDVQQLCRQYPYFIKPDIHLVCAERGFGIPDLRSRIGIAFELANYNQYS